MQVTKEFRDQVARIEKLIQKLESAADPALRSTSRDLIQTVMELHGAGLDRILTIVSEARAAGVGLIEKLGRDELVSSLLVLYGLHPEDFETRVQRGLDKARQKLRSSGCGVELVAITGENVHVKITRGGSEDSSGVVREALLEAAPDAAEVMIDGGRAPAAGSNFVPLASLTADLARP